MNRQQLATYASIATILASVLIATSAVIGLMATRKRRD